VGEGGGPGVDVASGIGGIGTVITPEAGVFEGLVGRSSVIVWQPSRTVTASTAQAIDSLIATPILEFTLNDHI
jgi:hypothetical protein